MAQPKDFGYGEEQEMLKDSARRFMEDKQPLLALRESIKGTEDPYFGENRTGSYDKAAWNEMVGLGWTALAVPEEAGGPEHGNVHKEVHADRKEKRQSWSKLIYV